MVSRRKMLQRIAESLTKTTAMPCISSAPCAVYHQREALYIIEATPRISSAQRAVSHQTAVLHKKRAGKPTNEAHRREFLLN